MVWRVKNTQKYQTFLVLITKKKIKTISRNGEKKLKKNLVSTRFMASSLLNLVDHLDEGTHKIKCNYGYENKICESCGIKYKDCEGCVEYKNIKDDLILYNCLFCSRNLEKKL